MNTNGYEYDIAISFATEDVMVATEIAIAFGKRNISFYLFMNENNTGQNVKKQTWEIYTQKSMFTLAILSENYIQKRLAKEEWEAIQTVHRPENIPYIIPLRLDETPIDGLSRNTIYLEWKENAEKIADSIHEMVLKYDQLLLEESKGSRPGQEGTIIKGDYSVINVNTANGDITGIQK